MTFPCKGGPEAGTVWDLRLLWPRLPSSLSYGLGVTDPALGRTLTLSRTQAPRATAGGHTPLVPPREPQKCPCRFHHPQLRVGVPGNPENLLEPAWLGPILNACSQFPFLLPTFPPPSVLLVYAGVLGGVFNQVSPQAEGAGLTATLVRPWSYALSLPWDGLLSFSR